MADVTLRSPVLARVRVNVGVTVNASEPPIDLAGAATAQALATANLQAGVQLVGSAVGAAQAAANILKGVLMAGAAVGRATGVATIDAPAGGHTGWDLVLSSPGIVQSNLLDNASVLAWRHSSLADHWSIDSTIKPPGGVASLRCNVLNTDFANSGQVSIPLSRSYTQGDEIWVSVLIAQPAEHCFAPWGLTGQGAHKLCMLSRDANGPSPTGSNQVNEVVWQQDNNAGQFSAYDRDGSGSGSDYASFYVGFTNVLGQGDFRYQPPVDNSGPEKLPWLTYPLSGTNPDTGAAWSNYENERRRFASMYTVYSTPGNNDFRRGFGDPLSGGFRPTPTIWHRLTLRLKNILFGSPVTRITGWISQGFGRYYKVFDQLTEQLGNGPDYNGFNLLPYTTNRPAGGRKVTSISGISGVSIHNVPFGLPLGNGTLEYTAATGRFRFKSSATGDGYGTSKGYSLANQIDIISVPSTLDKASTTLAGAITLPQASIDVVNASGFPSSGTAVIGTDGYQGGGMQVQYTGKSGNTLTGCTGGTGAKDSGSPVRFTSYVQLKIDNPALLPASGVTEATVVVAEGRPDTYLHYAGFVESSGNSPIRNEGGHWPIDGDLPAWVPPPGQFANISLNTPNSLDPGPGPWRGYGDNAEIWRVWAGGIFCPDFGPMGALVRYGGGHNAYEGNEAYAFDVATRLWVRVGFPSPYSEGDQNSVMEFPDGGIYPPHTYSAPQYLPPKYGGGLKGSIMNMSFPGSGGISEMFIHRLPLDTPSNIAGAWQRYLSLTAANCGTGYTTTVLDTNRDLIYANSSSSNDGSGVISYSWALNLATGQVTRYAPSQNYYDASYTNILGFCPKFDMLILLKDGGPGGYTRIFGKMLPHPNSWVLLNVANPEDGPFSAANVELTAWGCEWSYYGGYFVTYRSKGSYYVNKLHPPASNPLTSAWTWEPVLMTGVSGATPSYQGNPTAADGGYRSFAEVPALSTPGNPSFIWSGGALAPTQIWRL